MTKEEELDDAIVLLATTDDIESDAYADATAVLLAQRRADLPDLLPRLFALADAKSAPMRSELTDLAAALLCRSMVDPPAANDHELQAVMDERAEQLAAWRDDDRAIAAASMALFYPTLRGAYVARLERHADLSAADALVFLRVESPPPWAWDRARTALRSSDAATRVAAALLLARQVPMSPELGAELDGILVLGCLTALSRVLVLQDLGIPELPKGPFGPSPDARADGTVVFAGANLVTLRVEDRNVTLRFRPEGLAKGDAIRLGRDAGGRPRVLEWTTSDGVARRVDVAPDGTRLA